MSLHIPLGPAWEIVGPLPHPTGPSAAAGRVAEAGPQALGTNNGGESTEDKGAKGGGGNIGQLPGPPVPRARKDLALDESARFGLGVNGGPQGRRGAKEKSANPFTQSRFGREGVAEGVATGARSL